jgi:hypothetical protein
MRANNGSQIDPVESTLSAGSDLNGGLIGRRPIKSDIQEASRRRS